MFHFYSMKCNVNVFYKMIFSNKFGFILETSLFLIYLFSDALYNTIKCQKWREKFGSRTFLFEQYFNDFRTNGNRLSPTGPRGSFFTRLLDTSSFGSFSSSCSATWPCTLKLFNSITSRCTKLVRL